MEAIKKGKKEGLMKWREGREREGWRKAEKRRKRIAMEVSDGGERDE